MNHLLDARLVGDRLRDVRTEHRTENAVGTDELSVEAGHNGRTRDVQHLTHAIVASRAEKLADGDFAGVGRRRSLQQGPPTPLGEQPLAPPPRHIGRHLRSVQTMCVSPHSRRCPRFQALPLTATSEPGSSAPQRQQGTRVPLARSRRRSFRGASATTTDISALLPVSAARSSCARDGELGGVGMVRTDAGQRLKSPAKKCHKRRGSALLPIAAVLPGPRNLTGAHHDHHV